MHENGENFDLNKGFLLADWQIFPQQNLITRAKSTTELEPRVMKLLVYLALKKGSVITREQLLNDIWSGVYVQEDSLTKAISQLRQCFDDDPKTPKMIRTIRKSGYQLIAEISPISSVSSSILKIDRASLQAFGVGGVLITLLCIYWFLGPKTSDNHHELRNLNVTRLTSYAGQELDPQLSPEGDKIVFVRNNEENRFNIQTKTLTSAEIETLTDSSEKDRYPQWSPNGDWIAFVRVGLEQSRLMVVPATGGPEKTLRTERYIGQGISWDREGEKLYYSRKQLLSSPFHLTEYDLSQRTVTQLTFPPEGYDGDRSVQVNWQNNVLGFMRHNRQGAVQFFQMETDKQLKLLHQEQGSNLRFSWHGNNWLFDGLQSGHYAIHGLNTESGNTYPLKELGSWTLLPSVHRTLSKMVYLEMQVIRDVMQLSLIEDGHPSTPLIESSQLDFDAYFDHKGEHIAYVSSAVGNMQLFLAGKKGKMQVQLTHLNATYLASPKWSIDDKQIALQVNQQDHNYIALLDLESGDISPVVEGESINVKPEWSSDNSRLFFGSDRTGDWQIWQHQLVSGKETQLTRNGGRIAKQGADIDTLYYTKQGQPGIWKLTLNTGEESLLIGSVAIQDLDNWLVDKHRIIFVKRVDDQAYAWQYNLHNEKQQMIALLPQLADVSISLNADGKGLLFTASRTFTSDIMLAQW